MFVVIYCCCFVFAMALGEGAFGDFGHECEPFMCVDMDWHDDCFVLVLGVTYMLCCLVGFP